AKRAAILLQCLRFIHARSSLKHKLTYIIFQRCMAVNIVDVFVNDKYKQRTLSPQTNMYDTKNTCRAGMLKNGKEKGVVCHALHNGCGDSFAGTRHTLRKRQINRREM